MEKKDNRVFYQCYLTGDMCQSLLKNLFSLEDILPPSYFKLLLLSSKKIFEILDNMTKYDETKVKNLEMEIKEFKKLYHISHDQVAAKSWYIHILLNHVVDLIKIYGALIPFSTHNFESAHIDELAAIEKTSKNGGKSDTYITRMFPGFKSTSLLQFTLKKLRLLYLSANYGFPFDKQQKRNTDRFQPFLSEPYPTFPTAETDVSSICRDERNDEPANICKNCSSYCTITQDETNSSCTMPIQTQYHQLDQVNASLGEQVGKAHANSSQLLNKYTQVRKN